jgi:hypothetical protein
MVMHASEEGTPQRGPLSPLLSNIMLNELVKKLARRGHPFVRYADDSMIFCKTQRAAERVRESITKFIEGKYWCPLNRYNDLWNPFGLKESRSKHYATSPSFNFVHFQEGLPKPSPMLPPNPFPGVPRIHERQYST